MSVAHRASAASGTGGVTTNRSVDGDGRLVAISTPSGNATLMWDPTHGVAQLATSSTGTGDTNYLVGLGREIAVRGGQGHAFAEDVFGSTEARGAAADLARSTAYDEFGVPGGGPESLLDEVVGVFDQQLRFGYRGEATADGLLHLRAREYAPGAGRFTSVDPIVGTPGDVTVATPYAYAANDPLNKIDPLGLSWVNPCIGDICARDVGGALVDTASDVPTVNQWNDHWQDVGGSRVDAYIEWTGEVPQGLDLVTVSTNRYYDNLARYHQETGESPDSLRDWFNVTVNPGYRVFDSCSKIGEGRWLDCYLAVVELGTVGIAGGRGLVGRSARVSGSTSAPNTGRNFGSYGSEYLDDAIRSSVVRPDLGNLSSKIQRQMGTRGWTPDLIDEAVLQGRAYPAVNKLGGANRPATRYVHPRTGQSVVIDNATGEVIQVGGPGFRY